MDNENFNIVSLTSSDYRKMVFKLFEKFDFLGYLGDEVKDKTDKSIEEMDDTVLAIICCSMLKLIEAMLFDEEFIEGVLK